ncbi:MAG: hypothetical protein P8100_06235 [bacterium]|jgi:3-hydroxyacyl-[acyl-carrier-protein] dehydratase
MLADQNEVLNYIPQREPIVMVDGLLEVDDTLAMSQLQLKPDNIFCEGGYFSEAGLIENMAQTAALQNGYNTILEGNVVKKGFIGAIKQLTIHNLPKDSELINTTVQVIHTFEDVTIVKAEVMQDGLSLAEAELSIFILD